MKLIIINQDEIPENLPPGEYQTEIISASYKEIRVKFIGPLDKSNPSLFKIIKKVDDEL